MNIVKICPTQYIDKKGKWQINQKGYVLYEENGVLFKEDIKEIIYPRKNGKSWLRGEE